MTKATEKRVVSAVEEVIRRHFSMKSYGGKHHVFPADTVTAQSSQLESAVDNMSIDLSDGVCIIESTVLYEYCGYCRSHGY